ncbi:putative Ig domain-containing protein,Cadherin domain-containing protein [Burkholderiales bacterium JOSHI_001]|nr:putative Ig domain-containing protein,Cadherin domain-containing protein [Burkholderiales bacterium JOSHI_001]
MHSTIARTAVQHAARLVVEAMEPRLLHSADLLGGTAALASADSLLQPQLQSLHVHSSPANTQQGTRQELVLLDTGITGADQLLADLARQQQAGRALSIVTFGAQDDALALLGQALQGQHDVAAVHIVSHGSDGVLALGSTRLDAATLMARAGEVAGWSAALAEGADLLLYGCDVAATDTGRALLQDLATLTGADVAASDDPTGATALGGDWLLEARIGQVEGALVFSGGLQADFGGVLSRLAYDGFSTTSGNLSGDTTGSGWADSWASSGNGLTAGGGGLADPGGRLPTGGGAVTASISSTLSTAEATRNLAAAVGAEGTTTWVSFLVRPNRTGTADFMGLQFGNTSATTGFVGYNGSGFILGRAGALSAATVSGVNAQAGQTTLLVLKLQSVAGNDTATLYVNPTPGLADPNSLRSVSVSNLDFGSFTRIGVSAGNGFGMNAAVLDEIRVGTSFLDVAPTSVATAPVITSNGGGTTADFTVAETRRDVTTVAAIDANADTLSFSIAGGVDAARFAINAGTGALTFVNAPDFEAPADANRDNIYTVQVQASDGARTDVQTLNVTVTDVSAVLNVNTFADVLDAGDLSSVEALNASAGADGKVSLREAVIAANNTAGKDLIALQAGTYELTIPGIGENQSRTGDLDILDGVTITGAGALNTSITGLGASALLHVRAGDSNISALTLRDGYTLSNGAAIDVLSGASLTLSQAIVRNNQAPYGAGAAILNNGALNLVDVELRDNQAGSFGGGLYHAGTALTMTRVTVAGNQANSGGAGAYLAGSGTQTLSNVTFSGNQTAANGAGLSLDSNAQLVNVTLANNNAASGGGLYVSKNASSVSLTNVLLSNNGGGNLIQANSAVRSLGNNISTDTVAALNQASDRSGANVILGALADNGGVTRTHALLAGSAGINAGNSAAAPATDQRGQARVGAADVGAYEYVNLANTAPTITSNGGDATASLSVVEHTTVVTKVVADDTDGDTVQYGIVGGDDAALFSIDAASGVLSFITAPDFDLPTDTGRDNTYQVRVQASDGLASDTQTLLVTVSNLTMTARDDSVNATAGVQQSIAVLANDSLGEGTQMALVDATPGAQASSMFISASQVLYTSQAAFSGTDSFSYRATDGSEGLVHYWNLSGQASDTVGSAQGQLYNGVATTSTGQFGQALHFDGANDLALIPDFAYSNEFTLSFWFRMADNNGTGYRYMYAHGTVAASNSLNVFFIEKDTNTGTGINNVLRTRILDGNDADNVSGLDVAATGLADNQWHQYTLSTQAGVGSRVYIDGSLRAAIANGGDAINPSGQVFLGTNTAGDAARQFTGDLDTLQFYNRTVDAAALYAGNLAQAQVTVNVAANSGAAPFITSGGGAATLARSVAENTTAVATITATDPEGAAITYGLLNSGDAALFSIDPVSGALHFRVAPDFEAPQDGNRDNVYTLTVSASDGVNVDLQTLNVTVTDVGGPLVVTTNHDTVDGDVSSVEALLANAGADGISLREALLASNASAGADLVRFNLGAGQRIIALESALPTITDTVTIDGSSQSGYAGAPLVALDGSKPGLDASGLVLSTLPSSAASGSVLRGLSIYGFSRSAIEVTADVASVLIAGNYLGVDLSGLNAPGNGKWGVDATGAGFGLVIGGGSAVERNLIGGHHSLGGIAINGTQGARVMGNHIGVGADGVTALSNAVGVLLANDVLGTVVGGSAAEGNLIAHNGSGGVVTLSANSYGAVLGNRFVDNGAQAIDQGWNGQIQPNDNEADLRQNMLVLASAETSSSGLRLTGQLDTTAGRTVRIEFFANDAAGAQGHGEGQRLLATLDRTVPANGTLSLDETLAVPVAAGQWISATVTQLSGAGGSPLRTSEFSKAVQVATRNLPPAFTQPGAGADRAALATPEGQSTVLTLSATDPDGQALGYAIAGGADAARFTVDAGSGQLSFNTAPDFENPGDANGDGVYEVLVSVSDGAGGSDTLALDLRVTDLNDNAPIVTAAQQFTLSETAPAGTLVGRLLASDADLNTTLGAWTLTAGNTGNAFALDASTGQLSVNSTAALASASGTRFTLSVTVGDGLNTSLAQTVVVDVTNVNQAPVAQGAIGPLSALQDVAGRWSLAGAFSDPDLGDTLTWTLSRSDGAWPAWLSFNPADLTLSGTPGAADVGTLRLQARVSDGGNLVASSDFELQVADRNDAPQGQDGRIGLDEDSTRVLSVADFGFSDPLDQGADTLAAVRITAISGPGLLALRGVAVTAGQEVLRADLDAGLLSYTPPSDANGLGLTRVDFLVRDSGDTRGNGTDLAASANTLHFDVNPLNDAPLVADRDLTLDENATSDTAVLTLVAGDADAGTVLRDFRIVSGNVDGAFALDAATGVLRVANPAALDFESNATFTLAVTVSDGTLTSEPATVTLRLADLNEAPAYQGGVNNLTVLQDQAFSLTLPASAFSDPDSGDALTWALAPATPGASLPAWLRFDPASRTLSGTPGQADVGPLDLRLVATDGGQLQAEAAFTLTVQDVANRPVLANNQAVLAENAAAGTPVLSLSGTDTDPGTVLHDFRIASGNLDGAFALDAATGVLRVANPAALDFESNATFTLAVTVSDGTLTSDPATVTVRLADLNEAPVYQGGINKLTVLQDQAFSLALPAGAFSDPDSGDALSWALAPSTPGASLPAWLRFDPASRTLSGTPGQADVGRLDLRLVATDGGQLQAVGAFTLTVQDLNDAPQGRDAVLTLDEDSLLVLSAADFGFSDVVDSPAHELAAVRIVNLPQAGQLQFKGVALTSPTELSVQDLSMGQLLYLPPADASGAGLARIGFQVRDSGGTDFGGRDTDPQVRTLVLNVNAVNDAPVVVRNELDLAGGLSAAPVIVITDPDTPPEQIQISVGAVSGGQFVLAGSSAAADSFTLAQVLAGQVRFERNLAQGEPGYQLAVADASSGSATPVASVGSIRHAELNLQGIDAAQQASTAATSNDPSATSATSGSAAASVGAAKATSSANTVNGDGAEASATAGGDTAATRLAPAAAALGDALLQAAGTTNAAVLDTRATPLTLAVPASLTESRLDLANRPALLGTAPLADLTLPTLAPLEMASLVSGSSNPSADVNALINRLDALRHSLAEPTEARAGELAGGTAMGLSLSVGYVVWLVRGGILASSMLAALPSWQLLDPLPMLGRLGNPDDDEEAERDQVESLFAKGHGAPVPAPAPQPNEEPAA